MTRNEEIRRIKTALKWRSGKDWSVTGGRGTAWGWITIDAPPKRRTWSFRLPEGLPDIPQNYEEYDTGEPGGHMAPVERQYLAQLLGLDRVHFQGHKVPAGSDYYQEYIDRANGRKPTVIGKPYWD